MRFPLYKKIASQSLILSHSLVVQKLSSSKTTPIWHCDVSANIYNVSSSNLFPDFSVNFFHSSIEVPLHSTRGNTYCVVSCGYLSNISITIFRICSTVVSSKIWANACGVLSPTNSASFSILLHFSLHSH